jgi:transcriptional regulator with XRE-family HTH domain
MKQKFKTYLRAQRRRWGLTQGELAYLLGYRYPSAIWRIERDGRQPTLSIAFACHVIFGTPVVQLFPGRVTEIEDAVLRRSYKLHERLQGNPSRVTKAKLDLLEQVLKRAVARNANSA